MIRDLHTHSNASDGFLPPEELIALAASNGVDVLSITDHDTINAYKTLGVIDELPLTLIPGIELSTSWQRRSIHIVGLNIDLRNPELLAGIERQHSGQVHAVVEYSRTVFDHQTSLGRGLLSKHFDELADFR